jgi:hypothetical protein
MANSNFVVHNGLTVGPLTIDAATGAITTSGNISVTGSGSFGGLDAARINSGASNVQVTSQFVNVAIAGSNISAFRKEGFQTLGNVFSGADAFDLTVSNTIFAGFDGLTNTMFVGHKAVNAFAQSAIRNGSNGISASADFIAYSNNGDNNAGWIDMGATSSGYSDASFTITGPNSGYLFYSAPDDGLGNGDLLIGTAATGVYNDVVLFSNGFDAGNERMRIIGDPRVGHAAGVEILANTSSTNTTTGALRVSGGMGVIGDINVGGNVNIVGNITIGGVSSATNVNQLSVNSAMISLGTTNSGDLIDLGFYGAFVSSGTKYAGLVRDASDSIFKLFTAGTAAPTTTVDFTSVSYAQLYSHTHTIMGSPDIAIANGGTSGVGNIGATGATFNTIFAKATTAQYADLAEKYLADAAYAPGTVVEFGGDHEVTAATEDMGVRVAGVVSTQPGYVMNDGLEGENVVILALTGRVPTKVTGPIRKGDMLVSNGDGRARAETLPRVGSVIGKAIENFDGEDGVIEVVIGKH